MGPLKPRTRRNGAANKGGVAERGPERSEDRKCPLRSVVAAARFRVDLSTATASGVERFSRLEDTVRDHDQASHHRGDDLFGPLTIAS